MTMLDRGAALILAVGLDNLTLGRIKAAVHGTELLGNLAMARKELEAIEKHLDVERKSTSTAGMDRARQASVDGPVPRPS